MKILAHSQLALSSASIDKYLHVTVLTKRFRPSSWTGVELLPVPSSVLVAETVGLREAAYALSTDGPPGQVVLDGEVNRC